jgi:heme-degrading monooxygenase HmoA
MISRHWIGIVKKDRVSDYTEHLEKITFPELKRISGFSDSYFLTRETQEGIEFLVVTEWDSIEAIKKFAGQEYDRAVVPKAAQNMIISFETKVKHYKI